MTTFTLLIGRTAETYRPKVQEGEASITASSKDSIRSTLKVLLGQEAREIRTVIQDITIASQEPWTNQKYYSHITIISMISIIYLIRVIKH
jgi:hypothetical protein